ncbi:hypothetical protein J4212_04040 [Candidatus Woesearchaeota archaeon]|nr:hypothetical protein [Candidatus Woesearchaeota archaeon]
MYIERKPERRNIILIAVIISIILYLAGVFSGLYANKIVKESTEEDIKSLEEQTRQNMNYMQSYVDILDTNLKNIQLEQAFLETLSDKERCSFSKISLEELVSQLSFYWEKLPFRLEEYERTNEPTEEYLALKSQYTYLSIRIWMLAKSQYETCGTNMVHGLYFYSKDCENCVEQGEQIDELNRQLSAKGSDIIMFPIDFSSREPLIRNLEAYYRINSTPAIVLNGRVMQGRLFTSGELLKAAEDG